MSSPADDSPVTNINGDVNNINVNNINVNNNISKTINNNDSQKGVPDVSEVKTEIKLELAALDLNLDDPSTQPDDNLPLDQLVNQDNTASVDNADGNDDCTEEQPAAVEKMKVDDPEAFGPFSQSQITANIQDRTDQMFYDSFHDQVTLLETAIGKFLCYELEPRFTHFV